MVEAVPGLALVARRFGLRLIVRFGSTATGRASPESDQDIGVLSRARLDLDRQAELVVALEEALGKREVDLTILNGADPLLMFQVARHGIPLFEAEPCEFIVFQSYAARRYDDTGKYRAALRRWLEGRLA